MLPTSTFIDRCYIGLKFIHPFAFVKYKSLRHFVEVNYINNFSVAILTRGRLMINGV